MVHLGITVRNTDFTVDEHELISARSFQSPMLVKVPSRRSGTNQETDADGLLGAIKINGPSSMNYDYDLGPVLITDHFHKTAFSQVMLEYLGKLLVEVKDISC